MTRYRRWTFGLAVEIDPDDCSVCNTQREGDGRHLSLADCESERGSPCPAPEQHHRFRGRRIPIHFERKEVW